MNIELKRLSVSERLSQETLAFAADVWIDGKKAGTAENSGHGGNTNVWINDPTLRAAAETYAKSLPARVSTAAELGLTEKQFKEFGYGKPLPMDLESLIDNMAADQHAKKAETAQYKRWCKKSVCFRVKGDEVGTWRTLKSPYNAKAAAFIRTKYGETLEEILNERFLSPVAAA